MVRLNLEESMIYFHLKEVKIKANTGLMERIRKCGIIFYSLFRYSLLEIKINMPMHEMHEGKLKSGKSGKKVTNPKQAVAIGLSEARKEGDKVPKEES